MKNTFSPAVSFGPIRGDKTARKNALTSTQWIVCLVAGIGFLFDAYEIVVQAVTVRPALMSLGSLTPGSPRFNQWVGMLFYLPYLAGGVFGLLGGYLTDRYGRRKVLVWSIALYGIATAGAAYSISPEMFLLFRCLTIIGVCVEWTAALAWIAELFPEDRRRREAALGYTQACGSLGAFLVGGVYFLSVTYGQALPVLAGGHEAWRYTLLFGAVPVLPVVLLRFFSPESAEWKVRKLAGTLQRPSFSQLFQPAFRRTTIVTCVLMACISGAIFGALQHVPRMVPGLFDVRSMRPMQQEQTVAFVHVLQDFGNLTGRLTLAVLAVFWLSRRPLLRAFQIPGLIAFPLVFFFAPHMSAGVFAGGAFVAALFVSGQLSFIGNYLPQAYPLHLRGTGESLAMSVGGRMIGPAAALLTTYVANFTPGTNASEKLALAAAGVSFLACAIGMVASHWLPEPGRAVFSDECSK